MTLLNKLEASESLDISALCLRLGVLKEVAHTLLDEVEALENVRSVDIKHGINLHEEVQQFELDLIIRALERTGGNQTHAAQLLGLKLTTLHSKLKRYNISPQAVVNPITAREHSDEIMPPASLHTSSPGDDSGMIRDEPPLRFADLTGDPFGTIR